tara:strand:- start:806 stop:1777 length:972 start_codon:yes stop_codon:yes gene_type:complete
MIVLTGGAGFIGKNLIAKLNQIGIDDILIIDKKKYTKSNRFADLKFSTIVDINEFSDWHNSSKDVHISSIIHLGACTNTLENNYDFLHKNNVLFSRMLWDLAVNLDVPFIYASSAATYGNGENGFFDDHSKVNKLEPLNPYGRSKQEFDQWTLRQEKHPPFWAGLKFFNVYGPGEQHKGKMASAIHHFIYQNKRNSVISLFEGSHGFYNGDQSRDFIYIDDVIDIMLYLINNNVKSGIYNVGTGAAVTFNKIAETIINIMNYGKIQYIPFPEKLKNQYQAYTCACLEKIKKAGYLTKNTRSLKDGIKDYIDNYKPGTADKFEK